MCLYFRLEVAGFGVGLRFLELLSYREKQNRRELRLLGILQVLRLLLPLVYFVVILLTYRIVFFYNIGLELLSHFRYQFIHNVVWRQLFGKTADALEKSAESDDSYMIQERDPITNRFISTPSNGLNCASFIAGIIHGVLDGAGFPSEVSAHFVSMGPGQPDKTVFLVKFDRTVLDREARLSHS